ncbi:MAG: class 1 fructose-bisphosphatase [Sulfurospirillaceae bacterium]|jgi:fructose-1,6-bisphosphatase I|nr:class 1 fructose-bisphosphatase [Sulfurospirillaceae bacterium]MCK9545760.1 class 1 fructose-bisphosphatase [Sulfurospirillaceae bacterium]MDY0238118.1 class 1 fructose-bisphosphatase [Campylobacterales bacterium]NLN00082.1 class 1 fructose-bisphosphatase [Campylobacteraceae bacterium]
MEEVFKAIKEAAKRVSSEILDADVSALDSENITGDTQLKLDILSDKIIEDVLKNVSSIYSIISEEKDSEVIVNEDGKYIVGYDPLDGSSLVDVNLSIGSIFGIYEGGISGKDLKAAAYVVYGPRVELVIATDKVRHYRLKKSGEFEFLSEIFLKEKGKLNAPGSTQKNWFPFHKELIDSFFKDGYRLRYSGGMVPDLHQILLKGGGLFSYPATIDLPKAKLRMVFEVFPFAFIFEKASGGAIDGKVDLLSLTPSFAHDTTPCFFGSKNEIERVKEVYARN